MFNVMDEKICLSLKTLPTCVCKTLQKILFTCVARPSELIFESESIQESETKPLVEDAKKPEQATLSTAEPEKGKYQRGEKAGPAEEEDPKKLKMGKGVVPDKKDSGEDVKLKPIPEKQVN